MSNCHFQNQFTKVTVAIIILFKPSNKSQGASLLTLVNMGNMDNLLASTTTVHD